MSSAILTRLPPRVILTQDKHTATQKTTFIILMIAERMSEATFIIHPQPNYVVANDWITHPANNQTNTPVHSVQTHI